MSQSELIVPEVAVITTFCEDIRFENNGKAFIIGIFGRDLIVPMFPAALPKLVAQTTIAVPPGPEWESITLIYEMPDGSKEEVALNYGEIQAPTRLAEDSESLPRRVRISSAKAWSNFEIKKPGYIKIRARIGDKKYAGGSLRIIDSNLQVQDSFDNAIDLSAVNLVLGYLGKLLPVIGGADLNAANRALISMLSELSAGRADLQLIDSQQPVWFAASRTTIWVLKTQPWHTGNTVRVALSGDPVAFTIEEENVIAIKITFSFEILAVASLIEVKCELSKR